MHLRPALALTASLAVAAALASAPAQAAPNPEPVVPAVESAVAAVAALDVAEAAAAGKGDRDLTLALRDLSAHRDELVGADRQRADALLRRPAGNRARNFERVRVHWTSGETTSSYANKVGAVADHVLGTYAAAGYRPPVPDGTAGGNSLLDIYLDDIGFQGYYGWCASDDPPSDNGPWDAPAYCAFDNDYAEFPNHTPMENLKVTAAHELFHAVQFAYDFYEDGWFVEATATWAEDELYDDVNDNVQYLSDSPLSQPTKSMDRFGGMRQYGDWIFFRYLTERDSESEGGLPTLVRDMWERADGAAKGPDDYSIEAVANVLAERGKGLRATWARFAAANRRPGSTYDEGASLRYPAAKPTATIALTGSHRRSGLQTRSIDHLASKTLRFTRAERMKASSLKVDLDLPSTSRGSGAVATIYRTSGRPTTVPIGLDKSGDGVVKIEFGRDVSAVEVTLANAGIGYNCWLPGDTGFSCNGRPKDDGLPFRVRVTALR